MTESQRQFEEWAVNTKDQFGLPFFIIKDESGKYVDHAAEISWQAWQASRAAVVVSLPETHNDWLDKQVVQYAIDEAGVSYD